MNRQRRGSPTLTVTRRLVLLAAGIGAGLGAIAAAPEADPTRPVSPEDICGIRAASDPQVSPDGSRVAFVVTEPAEAGDPQVPRDANIWVVPLDGGAPARRFTTDPAADTMPRWSPDGRRLAFLSQRGAGTSGKPSRQIYLIGLEGGEAEALTKGPGDVQRFRWSPGGTMLAFTREDPPGSEEEARAKSHDDAIHVDHDDRNARLWTVRLADRVTEQVTRQDFHVSDFDWSPDESELAVATSPSPRADDVYYHTSLRVVRRQGGDAVRTLCAEMSDAAESVRWSPDGRTIAFAARSATGLTLRLGLVPAAGGAVRTLLDDYPGTAWFDSWGVAWEPDARHLLTESIEKTRARLLRVDAASGETTVLADAVPPFIEDQSFSIGAGGRVVAYMNSSGQSPPDVWGMRAGETPRRLTDLNPQIASLRLGAVSEISWKNRKDGRTLYGVLITPPGFKAGRPSPAIVQVHGGPEWAWWSGWHGSWHEWGQLLASNGYVVFLPNPRGSYGQGWRFVEANRDDWGGMDLRDILDGLDDLVARKIADPDRLGIGGWSYGGFMTSWAITQTGRFKAAIMGAGVSDLFSMNGTSDIPGYLKLVFLDTPFNRRHAYDAHSAMTFIKNCKTPTLVLHGQADGRVPVSQGLEFYNGLKSLGVETEMVIYPREQHPIEERPHQIDLLKRVLDWYDRHLKN